MPLRPSSWHFDTPTREGRTSVEVVLDSEDLEEVDEVFDIAMPSIPTRNRNEAPAGPSLPRHVPARDIFYHNRLFEAYYYCFLEYSRVSSISELREHT